MAHWTAEALASVPMHKNQYFLTLRFKHSQVSQGHMTFSSEMKPYFVSQIRAHVLLDSSTKTHSDRLSLHQETIAFMDLLLLIKILQEFSLHHSLSQGIW